MAQVMTKLVGQPTNERYQQLLDWIAIEFCKDIHGPQRMNTTDFDDPRTLHLEQLL